MGTPTKRGGVKAPKVPVPVQQELPDDAVEMRSYRGLDLLSTLRQTGFEGSLDDYFEAASKSPATAGLVVDGSVEVAKQSCKLMDLIHKSVDPKFAYIGVFVDVTVPKEDRQPLLLTSTLDIESVFSLHASLTKNLVGLAAGMHVAKANKQQFIDDIGIKHDFGKSGKGKAKAGKKKPAKAATSTPSRRPQPAA